MFDGFPRHVGIPNRYLIMDNKELSNIIFKYNGIRDIYIEIYKEQQVDKILFDLDSHSCYINTIKLHKYLVQNNLKHVVFFTGRGFHVYVKANSFDVKNSRGALINASDKIAKEVGLRYGDPKLSDLDHHIRGDLSRIARIPYTINMKSGLYCCSVSDNMLNNMSFDEIKQYAKNPERKFYYFGENEVKLKEVDFDPPEILEHTDVPDIDRTVDISENLPECIKNMLRVKDLRYRDRYLLLVALKQLAFSENEVKEILKKYLSAEKYHHCVNEEHQVRHVFKRDDMMSHDDIVRKGYCTNDKCRLSTFYKRWNNGRGE